MYEKNLGINVALGEIIFDGVFSMEVYIELRPDWEVVKLSFMEEIVSAKFEQNHSLKQMLLATGNALLKEGNTWNDVFRGVNNKTGKGENNLGKILMRVREKLR